MIHLKLNILISKRKLRLNDIWKISSRKTKEIRDVIMQSGIHFTDMRFKKSENDHLADEVDGTWLTPEPIHEITRDGNNERARWNTRERI